MKNDFLKPFHLDIAVAVCLLTRLPLPHFPDKAFGNSARAVWAYPLVGLVLASMASLVWAFLTLIGMPNAVGAGLVLALLILITGAMHEDGLADCADGFWGSHDKARRLEIMKDSQIGTYGTLALTLATGIRWVCYTTLLPLSVAPLFVAVVLSRAMMSLVMVALPHARDSGLSHGVGRPSPYPVGAGLLLSTLVALFLSGPLAILAVLGAALVTGVMILLAHRKISGQTGDVLGATQQISEITILILFTARWF